MWMHSTVSVCVCVPLHYLLDSFSIDYSLNTRHTEYKSRKRFDKSGRARDFLVHPRVMVWCWRLKNSFWITKVRACSVMREMTEFIDRGIIVFSGKKTRAAEYWSPTLLDSFLIWWRRPLSAFSLFLDTSCLTVGTLWKKYRVKDELSNIHHFDWQISPLDSACSFL